MNDNHVPSLAVAISVLIISVTMVQPLWSLISASILDFLETINPVQFPIYEGLDYLPFLAVIGLVLLLIDLRL